MGVSGNILILKVLKTKMVSPPPSLVSDLLYIPKRNYNFRFCLKIYSDFPTQPDVKGGLKRCYQKLLALRMKKVLPGLSC